MKRHLFKIRSVIGPALLITFTFFVFGPLEIYITNASNFTFLITQILPPILFIFIVALALLLLLNLLFPQKSILYTLTFSIGLALYIQGNLMQVDYGVMDGRSVDWGSYGSWGLINSLIWVAIILIPLVILFIVKNKSFYKALLQYISLGIVCVECITLSTLLLTTDLSKNQLHMEYEGKFDLSKNKNIVVMLFDAFQAEYFQQAVDTLGVEEQLDGFTFFDNAVGTSLYSQEGAATIYTGNQMQVDKNLTQNFEYAYRESKIIEALKQENYDIRYYVPTEMMSSGMIGTIANVKAGASTAKPTALLRLMLKITAFKYMPHNLKEIFWYSYDEIDKTSSQADTNETITGDIAFNQDVLAGKITATMKQNAYRVYYFKGVHPPYDMTRDVGPAGYKDENYVINYVENIQEDEMLEEQTLGCVRIITNYIEALKEKGLYDQTTIIITADHGWENRYNPMLLIKPANSTGPYQVSHAPVSYIEDFAPTVLSAIGDEYTTEKTVFDYAEDETRTRFFYVYDGISTLDRSYTKIEIFSTTGFADDESEYQLKQVLSNAKPYTIGTPIIFTNEDNGTAYFELGTSVVETDYTWSVGKEGKMVVPLEDNPTDLLAQFTFKAVYNGEQSVIVKSNDLVLFEGVVSASNPAIIFEVPASCIQDKQLVLDLYYPDAVSPASLNRSTDSRMLAVAYSKIVFSKMPDKENEINDELFH